MTIRVLSVASEAVPFVKTGGLADVAGALPAAVAPHGVVMTTLLPGYPGVLSRLALAEPLAAMPVVPAAPRARGRKSAAVKRSEKAGATLHTWPSLLGEKATLLGGMVDGLPLLVLDCPALFARAGGPYVDASGRDWADNWRRFAAFGRAAADIAAGLVPGLAFDVIHAHDWQAAMALAYLRFAPPSDAPAIPSVMTIHNMAFQGHFGSHVFGALGLPQEAFSLDGVEYHGGVGFLKAGLEAASIITTVSPTYAREIREADRGMGLDGLIRSRNGRVRGLLNGIDTREWNPAIDPTLPERYTERSLGKRMANKRALEAEFMLDRDDGPLFIAVTRLTWQKGMDVLAECIDHLVGLGGRLALLGSGDAGIVHQLHAAAARHPGRIGVRIGYDEALSHRMQAGGDAILIPSRFEPCGLTQLYGLEYGCVPVVARTGGLADTVIDANVAAVRAGAATGVQFTPVDYHGLADAITRTIDLYRCETTWRAIQRAGMRADFSWASSGGAYAALYRELAPEAALEPLPEIPTP